MPRIFKKSMYKKPGLPPGALIHLGEKRAEQPVVSFIDYDGELLREKTVESLDEIFPLKDKPTTSWIDVCGVHRVDLVEKTGAIFGIHPLVLEDIVNTHQRSKVEEYDNHLFVVARMLHYDKGENEVRSEQICLVLGENYVISFREQKGDVFEGVRERIRSKRGRIRNSGCDYLAYALLDAIVDHYFVVLGAFADRMEELEEALLDDPGEQISRRIHMMKREAIYLRKQIWPLREVLTTLTKGDAFLIEESTGLFLRDVHDHAVQVVEIVDSYRDVLSGMMDNYLSEMGRRMNEVMKLLTIIATIFIPVTFIAGVYGMNFQHMPELGWRWGYFFCLGFMAAIAIVMLVYFKSKDWL